MFRHRWTTSRAAAFFLICVAMVTAGHVTAADRAEKDRFARAWVIEVDGVRKSEHAAQLALPPASLTKMMTGLLVIESGRADAPVSISRHAASAIGSRLKLQAGERLMASDLLTAMLVASANDACRALAEWLAGSEAAFVALMNQRAEALGLRKTRFVNACGFDAAGHRSTASDLAMLARAAMAQPEYARRAAIRQTTIKALGSERSFSLNNNNALIGRFPGAYGVKSGFTAQAGKCVVAMAERNGHHVLLVMLDAKNRWWDADAALDYALDRAGAGT
jgi:serine-type D-Ala-D-Ala carboxypeptidase (penicillin-binding protein 5/6)